MAEDNRYNKQRILNAIDRVDLNDRQKKLLSELVLVADRCYSEEHFVSGVFSQIKLNYLVRSKPDTGGGHLYMVTVKTGEYQPNLFFIKIKLPFGGVFRDSISEENINKNLYNTVLQRLVAHYFYDIQHKKDLIHWLDYEANNRIGALK